MPFVTVTPDGPVTVMLDAAKPGMACEKVSVSWVVVVTLAAPLAVRLVKFTAVAALFKATVRVVGVNAKLGKPVNPTVTTSPCAHVPEILSV